MKIKSAFWTICFLSIAYYSFVAYSSRREIGICRNVQAIPIEDRAALEAFFRILLLEEGGAYVLFGDKPMAFTAWFDYLQIDVTNSRMQHYYTENQIIKKGWETWQKHKKLFPSDHFILQCKPFNKQRHEVCLINKKKIKKAFNENLKSFQSIIGPKISPEILLENYQNGDIALFHLLKQHDALLGILLGFGKENSWTFHEHAINIGDDPNRAQIIPIKISTTLSNLQNEFVLRGVFAENNHKKCYKFVFLPYFLADPNSSETRELQDQYLKQRHEIHKSYARSSFLETSLKKFCLDQ